MQTRSGTRSQRVREKMVARLAETFTRLAIKIAPKPPTPQEYRWKVTLDGSAPSIFYVMFLDGSLRGGEWHVAVLCEYTDHEPVLVDAGIGRSWITPLKPRQVDRVLRALRPEYLVTVQTDHEGWMPHLSIGPVTCVTLAKRLLGVHNPGVVTSRQLLDVLWRYRDGRS